MKKVKVLLFSSFWCMIICVVLAACIKQDKVKQNNITDLEKQILLYIQKGLYLYKIDGEYKVYFARNMVDVQSEGDVTVVLEKGKKSWLERINYKYDKDQKNIF